MKQTILLNLVQTLIDTLLISITDNQQFLPHGIALVTIQIQQMRLNIHEANLTENLSNKYKKLSHFTSSNVGQQSQKIPNEIKKVVFLCALCHF